MFHIISDRKREEVLALKYLTISILNVVHILSH